MTTLLTLLVGIILGAMLIVAGFIYLVVRGDYLCDEFTEPPTVIPDNDTYDSTLFTVENNGNLYIVSKYGNILQSYDKSIYNMVVDGNTVHFYIK